MVDGWMDRWSDEQLGTVYLGETDGGIEIGEHVSDTQTETQSGTQMNK